jgi:hypothetical protein
VFTRHNSNLLRQPMALFLLTLTTALAIPAPASAQSIFDLFGFNRRSYTPPSGHSYADPQPQFNFFGSGNSQQPTPRRSAGPSGGVVYCVRLCDGRYFPVQRHSGSNPAQVCNSFCPAAQTKIFSGGGGIEHAVANDGTRYANLPNAFAYRERISSDCTCNGKDPVGLVTTTASGDPTLRQGDIVANENGLVAFTGGSRGAGGTGEFTPIDSYAGLSGETRSRLAGVKVVPNSTPVPAGALVTQPTTSNRRAQVER